MKRTLASLALINAVLIGCSSGSQPIAQLSVAESAVGAAHADKDQKDPKSKLYLTLAQEQLAQGKSLMKEGENERAGIMFLRAQSDAELSLALAQESNAQTESQNVLKEIQNAQKKP